MTKVEQQLTNILKTIKGNGSFVTSGVENFVLPGLSVKGVGEIGFPLNHLQVKELIKIARKAPFGKGSQTITDTTVRSAWEIDGDQVTFHNQDWEKLVKQVLKKIKKGLGIEKQSVSPSLYKLLIYEQGDFFLAHKDSEKEKGMFGTLVVGLPSTHSGGELTVRFDDREEVIDFSKAASSYKIPYVAFFADCEHEIKPVTSGYRVGLVYNLIQTGGAATISGPQFSAQAEKMTELLKSMESSMEAAPKVILLGHQYTPANFSLAGLKYHDRPRAEALIAAAEQAGYFSRLGLVTHYQLGLLEGGDFYYDRYRKPKKSEEGTMGEVHDERTAIEHWSDDPFPTLGNLEISREDIVTDLQIAAGDPIEKEETGFTGNAGMTMEYWYHYGAVVLWPQRGHTAILEDLPVRVKLEWLKYYSSVWDQKDPMAPSYVRGLLLDLSEAVLEEYHTRTTDFTPAATALTKLKDEKFLTDNCTHFLENVFRFIEVASWVSLFQRYPPAVLESIFQKVGRAADLRATNHLLSIIKTLITSGSDELKAFALKQIQEIPEYLNRLQLSKLQKDSFSYRLHNEPTRKKIIDTIVKRTLYLSQYFENNKDWMDSAFKSITWSISRSYVNKILTPIVRSKTQKDRKLAKKLREFCLRDLQDRTQVRPTPPLDWSRETPQSTTNSHIWQMLRPFLSSPTQRVFEYKRRKNERREMERAISSVAIDLSMETIHKGSPHILRLTKTQASYERALANWEEDLALLEKLQTVSVD